MHVELHSRPEDGVDLPVLLWRPDGPHLAVSSAPLGGGIGLRRWVLNATVPMSYSRLDPDQPGRFLPNRAAAKAGLNRSILDAGWAQFVSIVRAKAEEAGRVVIDVDARHTSDRCEACGHTAAANRASQAVSACRACGHTAEADEHAARNILRAGLAHLAATPAA